MTSLLLSAFIYLASAAVAVPLSKRLGLGSVLGYLIAGVLMQQPPRPLRSRCRP